MTGSHDRKMPPRNLLRRLRRGALTDRLLKALTHGQVVLVRAAAGYGKTEFLAAAYTRLAERGEALAWLTLSSRTRPEDITLTLGTALGLEDGGAPATVTLDDVLERLHLRTAPVFLFLDAAERVADRPGLLDWLLEEPPACLRFVIAGRKLPVMRVSSFRLRGLLDEVDFDDLAFTRDEMRQVLGPWLSPAEQARLFDLLAAWPALVSLSAQILAGHPSPAARAQLLEGRHPALRDFLLQEALDTVNETGMAALRACCELPDFTLDIAANLAGLTPDDTTLAEMEELPPLIATEEQQIGWYRMHPLVAQVIRLVSGAESAAVRNARHIRAAILFEQRGLLEKAVLHACLGGDYDLAVQTVERAGGANVFLRAGYTVLQGIVQAVPHDVVRSRPSLRLCRGLMLAKNGRIREARMIVDALVEETRAGVISDAPNWAILEHISSLLDIYSDSGLDIGGIAVLEDRARKEPRENTWQLGWLFNHLTIAYTRSGDYQAAHGYAVSALACYQEEQSSYPQAFMLIHLAFVNLRANRLDATLTYSRQAETIIRSHQWNDSNLMAIAHVPLAATLYRQGQITEAGQMLDRAMPVLAEGEGWVDFYVEGYSTLARVRMVEGGWDRAEEVLQAAMAVADARDLDRLRLSMTVLKVELLTRAGLLDEAGANARQLARLGDWPTDRERNEAALVQARIDLRQGRHDAAAERLEAIVGACLEPRQEAMLLRCALLEIELHWTRGDTATALNALQRAAALSQPGQQVQQFHDEEGLAQHIRALTRKAGLSRIGRLSADYLARTAGSVRSNRNQSILSEREAEILALLDEGLTNKAIARRLGLAEPTVKFHLKNLYAKLGVSRRQLALNVAKGSGLLYSSA